MKIRLSEEISLQASKYGRARLRQVTKGEGAPTPEEKMQTHFDTYDLEVAFQLGGEWVMKKLRPYKPKQKK